MRNLPLRFAMRKLWAAHVRRTRNYLYALLTGKPDNDLTLLASRLLRNQDDVGRAVTPVMGDAAGRKLAGLLRDHVSLTLAVLKTLKAGDNSAYGEANKKWYAKAVEISEFLGSALPGLDRKAAADMLRKHLSLTAEEATTAKAQDWLSFSEAYRRSFHHMMRFSDALTAAMEARLGKRG